LSRAEIEILCQIARDAGRLIRDTYARDFQVDYKGPGDPVTEADRAANTLICARLQDQFPDAAIVAEESLAEAYRDYRAAARVFFVDPLDGTREFVAKNGEFVVMIGLLVEREVTLGVVYAPASDTLWYGAPGLGAQRVDPDGAEHAIRVSSVSQPSAARIAISRSRRSDELDLALQRLAPLGVVPTGSAGLKGAHVAEARVDAYLALGPAGKHWDACAMDALVKAAGGVVTDSRGQPLDYRSEDLDLMHGVLATNPLLQGPLLAKLQLSSSSSR
jgi:3'(2'), 5'-bisphosphate nucleotidase